MAAFTVKGDLPNINYPGKSSIMPVEFLAFVGEQNTLKGNLDNCLPFEIITSSSQE